MNKRRVKIVLHNAKAWMQGSLHTLQTCGLRDTPHVRKQIELLESDLKALDAVLKEMSNATRS